MLQQSSRPVETVGTTDEFEWVNAWAAQSAGRRDAPAADGRVSRSPHAVGTPGLAAVIAGTDAQAAPAADLPADFARDLLLAGDIIDIAEVRDALLANTGPPLSPTAFAGPTSLPAGLVRTADSVPIILGSVFGCLMVLVFATAAMFVKLAR